MFYIYDIETYPNVFSMVINSVDNDEYYTFEISPRRDDRYDLLAYIDEIIATGGRMVGYNNVGFDYPVIHGLLLEDPRWHWYEKAQAIIESEDRFEHIIYNPCVPQIDLFKIHHFDNKARSQSLKGVEFALRMDTIEDLPIEPCTNVPLDRIDELLEYNRHDVKATRLLFDRTLPAIQFRDALSKRYRRNFMNFSDVKCGSEVLITEIESSSQGSCYIEGTRQHRVTVRDQIIVNDILLPYIEFSEQSFKDIHDHFKGLVVTETKGAISGLSAEVNGFKFDFGLGGLHGSIESEGVHSDKDHIIVDVDVASYYPNLAIVNKVYPHHLSSNFCAVYQGIYEERKKHPKGSPENAMYKLALNGAYGNSNNPYSPLCDPQFTMTITINGQLLLAMLAEHLMEIKGCRMIQANTDGLTVRIPRAAHERLRHVCKWWEDLTGLTLEEVTYDSMFIRDVNNYLSISGDKVKRKGAYEYDYQLHQDPSATIVAKAVEQFLVNDVDVDTFIMKHKNPHDFTLRAKMTGGSKCFHGDERQQRLTRFHIATSGDVLTKVMPPNGPLGGWKKSAKPLTDRPTATDGPTDSQGVVWDPAYHTKNKSKHEERKSVIASGKPVVICNNMADFNWDKLDYQYYIEEAQKLIGVFQ